eukprot:Awhi_evm1s865
MMLPKWDRLPAICFVGYTSGVENNKSANQTVSLLDRLDCSRRYSFSDAMTYGNNMIIFVWGVSVILTLYFVSEFLRINSLLLALETCIVDCKAILDLERKEKKKPKLKGTDTRQYNIEGSSKIIAEPTSACKTGSSSIMQHFNLRISVALLKIHGLLLLLSCFGIMLLAPLNLDYSFEHYVCVIALVACLFLAIFFQTFAVLTTKKFLKSLQVAKLQKPTPFSKYLLYENFESEGSTSNIIHSNSSTPLSNENSNGTGNIDLFELNTTTTAFGADQNLIN